VAPAAESVAALGVMKVRARDCNYLCSVRYPVQAGCEMLLPCY
jgi:hypothetical protein